MIPNINGVNNANIVASNLEKIQPKTKEKKEEKSEEKKGAVVFEKAVEENFTTYDGKKIEALKASVDAKLSQLRDTVKQMIERQGLKFEDVLEAINSGKLDEIKVEIDEETRLKAQEEISEDGFWGVKQTSERILEFAKTISGGDKSKYDLLKNAIAEGFEKAREAFGGELPEISEQTYKAVMEGLEAWKNETETQE